MTKLSNDIVNLNPRGRGCARFLLLGFLILFRCALALALDVPPLRGRVNDYAGVMNQEQARTLESRLAQFEQETGHQVAVLTIPTLGGDDIEGFSIRLAENWKLGKKGFDDGVIFIAAIKDRRLRFEVGYGLEGILPDALVKRITSEYVVPHFRSQDYAGGIIAGIDAVLKVIKKEPLPESARKRNQNRGSDFDFFVMLGISLLVLGSMIVGLFTRQRNQMWATRGRGRGPMILGGPGGFGGGGFSSGGGFFGGGSGGGGFSGGGGGFGGGGASDSW